MLYVNILQDYICNSIRGYYSYKNYKIKLVLSDNIGVVIICTRNELKYRPVFTDLHVQACKKLQSLAVGRNERGGTQRDSKP